MYTLIQKIKEQYKIIVTIIVTLAICVGVFFYYGNEKEISFCDEVYSYTIINHGIGLTVRDNRWYADGEMDYRLNSSSGYFGYEEAIMITGQDVHPPVYYLVLKTFSMLFPQSTSKWLGLATNLLAFIPMLFLVYWGVFKNTENPWISAVITIMFGVHPGVQGCAQLIRMYFWLALWFMLFFILTKELCRKPEQKWWIYVALGIVTFLGFMTQYYFAVYVVIFSVFWCADILLHKKWKPFFEYMCAMIGAVVAATAFFPEWITHIFYGYKGQQSFSTLQSWENYAEELENTIEVIGYFVFGNYDKLYLKVLIVIPILILLNRKLEKGSIKKTFIIHLVTQILYCCIVAHVMPSVESRYFWSVIILQIVMYLWAIGDLLKVYEFINKKIVTVILAVLALVYTTGVPERTTQVPYLGAQYKEGRIMMEQYADIPWIYYGERNWQMHCSAFDILIPNQLMYIRDLSTLVYDEVLINSQEIVIYAQSEEDIMALVEQMEIISGIDCEAEFLVKRPYNYAYLLKFQ